MRINLGRGSSATIHRKKLENAVTTAFERTLERLDIEFRRAIETPGLFSGFPGDIVDTGALRDSQRIAMRTDAIADFSWPVDYARAVHEGYQLRDGGWQPGRPWTDYAIAQNPPDEIFAEILRGVLHG